MKQETMIERVARALCEANAGEWKEPPYNSLHTDVCNNHWRYAARAAIEAMREPTDAMVRANGMCSSEDGLRLLDEGARTTWRSMIDAALKEEKVLFRLE